MEPTIYEDLKAAGCQVEGHESDLYVRATDAAVEILRTRKVQHSLFVSPVDQLLWAEVAFAYDPFYR